MIILFKQISNKIPFEPSMCLLWEIATRSLENEKRKSKRQKKKKKKKEIRRNTLLGKIQAIHSFVKSRGRKVRRRTNVELAVNRVQF